MKKCPFCAEEINDAAVKCKHCGSDLTAPAPKPGQPSATGADIANPKKGKDRMVAGCLIMVIGLIIFIGIGSQNWGVGVVGLFVILGGLALMVVGKFQNWYHWK